MIKLFKIGLCWHSIFLSEERPTFDSVPWTYRYFGEIESEMCSSVVYKNRCLIFPIFSHWVTYSSDSLNTMSVISLVLAWQ